VNVTDVSVMALWTAATLYAIAMVAYSVRLARVAESKLNAKAAVLVTVPVPMPVAVAVGAAGAIGSQADAADAPPAASPTRAPGARAKGIGRSTMLVGFVLHLVGVVTRGIDAGHAPWSSMYEFTITGTMVAVAVFLFVQRKRDITYIAPAVAGFAAFAVVTGLRVWYRGAVGLQPALDSYWLVIHVPIAIMASGIFGVSGAASVLQVMRIDRESELKKRRRFFGWLNLPHRLVKSNAARALEAVPQPQALESLTFRLNAIGFVLWTFTVMSGAMWAEHAWGRFWGWDPKEVWSFVIWIIYAAYLHSRTTQGWAGRRAAVLAISGFVAIVLNFTVVNLYVQGLHSYSGLK
jgi:cytochrome c-type biogenesis protein CcsB